MTDNCIKKLPKETKASLLSSVFSKNFFLWIGSGFSRNFGYASWNDVLVEASKKLEYPLDIDTSNPLRAAELLCSYAKTEKSLEEYNFNSIIAESLLSLHEKDKTPDWLENFRKLSTNMIVTTNWDNVLEDVIFDGLPNVIVREDNKPQVSITGKNIFKIHGDLGRPSSIVVTQSQYFSFQREDTYLNRKIYTLFSESSPIFLGYSLTDPNINFIYEEVYAHLGEKKPPAFMVVRPSVSEHDYQEAKLLFKDKNIFIIKAEIGEFLGGLLSELEEYKNSTKRFLLEYKNIKDRLCEIFNQIKDKDGLVTTDLLKKFNTKDSRHQAISAITEILSNQIIYKEFDGELLSPENRMSYREIEQTITAVISMVNKDGYPNNNIKESFHKSVMELCAKSNGVWDFYTAEKPFKNILRISPSVDNLVFKDRLKHIVKVLRWSSPNEVGKCWSTWDVFCSNIDWINEKDITQIIRNLESDSEYRYRPTDNYWVSKLKNSKHCTESQKNSIDKIIETT